MGNPRLETVLQRVRHAWITQAVNDVTDAELLHRFVRQRDPAAFELLLRRHERMVFGVCRRLMRDGTDAEDVFQTTFLTLVCKAHTIARGQSVAAWLHRVACRAARRAAALRAKRLTVERATPDLPAIAAEGNPLTLALQGELAPVLHEELSKLPEKYRAPLVLCYLEGKTYAEGARQLGCPPGTLSIRLKRGRDLLRQRLEGRGLVLTAAGLATALSEQTAPAAVAAGLVASTLKAGLQVAGGSALADVVSPRTAALTESMVQTMSLSNLKLATAVLVFALGVGLAVSGWVTAQPTPPAPPPAKAGQTLTSNDVLKGYKQNYARFETLRVSWAQSQEKLPAWFKSEEAHIAHLKKVVTRPDLKPNRKDELRRMLEIARYGLTHPSNKGKQFLVQDFWTDRRRFQIRTPWREFQPVKQPGDEQYRFPDQYPDKLTLETTYKDICVLSFPGDLKQQGFRFWEGRQKQGSHLGGIFLENPNPNLFPFPPLSGDDKRLGAKWHTIDTFFALPADQLTVTGTELVDGRKTHVVSHTRVNKDVNTFLGNGEEYQGRLHRVNLTRAWVDVSKGCLPVKIEWESYYIFHDAGKSYSTRSGPSERLEVKSVEQVKNGGYYPVKGLLTRYGVVRQADEPSFDDFLRGKGRKDRSVAVEEHGWDAYLVQAGRKMEPGLFALEYPKNTLYYDQITKKRGPTSDD